MTLPPLTLNAWLRYDVIRMLLRDGDEVERVLEIGAGGGAMGARLARRFEYVGVEPDARSFETARTRLAKVGHGTVVPGEASALDPSATFDLVCAFEVLEHIEDDAAALIAWRERLRPGGRILLSVPAHPSRFAAADRKAGHYRRYEPDQLAHLLHSVGFRDALVLSYGFPLGYLLEWGRNAVARRGEGKRSMAERTGQSGRYLQPPDWLSWPIRGVTAPFRWMQRPFLHTRLGTGLIALARRSG
jgi:SAM-dependent methyltransferase